MGRKALYLTVFMYVFILSMSLSAVALGFNHIQIDKDFNLHIRFTAPEAPAVKVEENKEISI